jgi:D-beta-D-heptose 7-phosphate kinase/D-beta-D-heptose 1-phosphate adenosyltransferase
VVAVLHRAGQRVVFTNGCFDLVHVGHVHYLEAARRLGDVLIVGINDDRSVRRLKGASRPLQRLMDRSRVLAALESVDWVVSFGGLTPLSLIRMIRPSVLVKGGDWAAERIVGGAFVTAYGGEVRTIPLVPGRSTTRLLQRLSRASR